MKLEKSVQHKKDLDNVYILIPKNDIIHHFLLINIKDLVRDLNVYDEHLEKQYLKQK